ncbi:uncharacterized protein LOC135400954 isoform X2 [Ornithodoros turicata]|uniref:uncharacterized protein LOC135400954 isoform X2 n=1 Tax=Ornithodoros turicata TaxID=34597 RepID=UPI003139191D
MARITRSRAKLSAASNEGSGDIAGDSIVKGTSKNEIGGTASKECHDQENTDEAEGDMEDEAGGVEQQSGHSDDDDAQYDIEDPLFEPLVLDSVKDEDDTGCSAEAEVEPRENMDEQLRQTDLHVKSESNEYDVDTSSNDRNTTDHAVVATECPDGDVKETVERSRHCDEELNQTEFTIVSEVKEGDGENLADEAEMATDVKIEDLGNNELGGTVAEHDDDVDAGDEEMVLVTNLQDLCPFTPLPEEKRITVSVRRIIEQEVRALIEKLLYDKHDASCSKSGTEMSTPSSQQELKTYGCNLCGVRIGHPGRFEIHSNSRKHLQYLRWVNGINLNKEQGQFYCGVCRVSLPGKDVMSSHFKSDRHGCLSKLFNVDDYYGAHVMERINITGKSTKLLQGTPQKTPGKLDDRSFTFKEDAHTERQGVRGGLTPTSRPDSAEQGSRQNVQGSAATKSGVGTYRCDLCGVTVARQSFLQQHFNGKRHRTQVRLHEKRAAEQNFAQLKDFYQDFEGQHWEEAPQNPPQGQTEMSEAPCPEQGDVGYSLPGASEVEMGEKFVEEGQGDQECDEVQTGQNYEEDEAVLQKEEDEMVGDGFEYESAQGADMLQGSEEDEQQFPTEQTWSEEAVAELEQVEEDENNENQDNEDDEAAIVNDENVCIEEAEEDAPADEESAAVEDEAHADSANTAPHEGTSDAVAELKKDEEKASENKEGKEKSEDEKTRESRRDSRHGHSSSRDSHRHSQPSSRREPNKDSRRSSGDSRGRRTSNSKDAKGSGADSKGRDARSTKSDSKDGAKDVTKSESKAKSSTDTKSESKGDTKREHSRETKGDSKGDSRSDPKSDPKRRPSDTHHSHPRDRKSTFDSKHGRSLRDPKPKTPSSSSRDPKPSSSTLRRRSVQTVQRDAGRVTRRRALSPERPISSKKPKYSCFACKVAIFSDRDYKEHFDSRRHRQEVERREKKEEEERAARRRSSSPRSYRRHDRSRSPVDRWRITAPLVTQPPHQAPDPSFVNAQWLNPAAFLPLQQQLQQHPQQHLAQLQQPQQHLHQLAQAPQHIPHLQQPVQQQQQCLPDVFGVAGALPQAAAPSAQALPLESYTERRPVVAGALDNMILLQQRLLTLASATGANAGAAMPITQDYDAGLQARQSQQPGPEAVPRRPQERSMHQHESSLRQGQQYKGVPQYSQSKQNPPQQQMPFMEGSVSGRGRMRPEYNAGASNSHINYRSSTADGGAHPYFSQKASNSPSHGIPSQVTARDPYGQPFQQSTTNPSSRYGNVLDASVGSKSQTRADSQPSSLARNQRSQYTRPGINTVKAGDVDNSYQYMQKRF